MSTFQRILVPTDFHAASSAALDLAIELAVASDASIVVLHAYEAPIYAYPGAPLVPAIDITPDLVKAAQIGLDTTLKATQARWPRTSGVLRMGPAWRMIIEGAKQDDADLIVMGTHGRHGFSRALLGSVAEKVVRMSTIPVLTVNGRGVRRGEQRNQGAAQ